MFEKPQNQITSPENHFDAIVREHYEPLFRFTMRLTRTEHDAKDLTQQTFYLWAAKGHQLRDTSKLKPWLFMTLRNAFLKERQKRMRFICEDAETLFAQLAAPCAEDENPGDRSEVLSALARVDEVYRVAVSLCYLNGCSYHEIVALLEIPIGTVKSRIARGIAQLREILLSNDSHGSWMPGGISSNPVAGHAAAWIDNLLLLNRSRPQWSNDVDRNGSSTLLTGTSSRLRNHTDVAAACRSGN
jgi:RNA polymerase sigma-70 factor (ECF subfamily)